MIYYVMALCAQERTVCYFISVILSNNFILFVFLNSKRYLQIVYIFHIVLFADYRCCSDLFQNLEAIYYLSAFRQSNKMSSVDSTPCYINPIFLVIVTLGDSGIIHS